MIIQVRDIASKTSTIKFLDYWLAENGYYGSYSHAVSNDCIFIYGVANIYDDKNGQIAVYRAMNRDILREFVRRSRSHRTQIRPLKTNINDPEFFDKFGNFLNICQHD